jgi:hypothetical protein
MSSSYTKFNTFCMCIAGISFESARHNWAGTCRGRQKHLPMFNCSWRPLFCSWRDPFSPVAWTCRWALNGLLGSVAEGPKFRQHNILTSISKFYAGPNFFASSRRVWLIWQKVFETKSATLLLGHFAPRQVLPQCINMSNFRYEDGFKIKNKYFPAISSILYMST